MPRLESLANLLGRLLLALIFLVSGLGKIPQWNGAVAGLERMGVPSPQFLLAGAVVFELAGGLSLLVGFQARLGAFLLMAFLIPATLLFHTFWRLPADETREIAHQTVHFLKNLAILGGLLLVMARGAGPLSFDNRRRAPTAQY